MKTYLDYKMESQNGLFRTQFEDGYVIWKPLSWGRYKKYREANSLLKEAIHLEVEETVFQECLIESSFEEPPPPDLDEKETSDWIKAVRADTPAGVISTVVKLILKVSGATTGPAIIEQLSQHRGLIHNVEDQLTVAICKAFPAYTPEMVEALDWQTVLKRAAQAEVLLDTVFELESKEEPLPKKFNVSEDLKEVNRGLGQNQAEGPNRDEMIAERRRQKNEYMKQREALLSR